MQIKAFIQLLFFDVKLRLLELKREKMTILIIGA